MRYTIEEGNHKANGLNFGLHTNLTSLDFKIKFDDNCWYKPLDFENDYNKLTGWSYGILPRRKQVTWTGAKSIGDTEIFEWVPAHHYNSIRVGWRPYAEERGFIEVNLYVYEKGVLRVANAGLLLSTDITYDCSLIHAFSKTVLAYATLHIKGLSNSPLTLPYTAKPSWGYMLYPYFGGNAPAPHTVTLNLKS